MSLVKFSQRSDQQFNVKLTADRQTDRHRVKHNLLGGGNHGRRSQGG